MPKMTPTELKAMLAAEKANALGGSWSAMGPNSNELASERARAMNYYYGDVSADMPTVDGRSKAVSTDVSDTIEGLMPVLIEIFAAGEEVIRFDPVGPEDEDAAQQETDYVNYVFMQKNQGFLILYSFIKDALLSKNGFVKGYWDKGERQERETYLDQPDDVFAILSAEPDAEIAEHKEHKDEQGQTLHDVTLVRKKGYGYAKVEPVPPEEFGISARAKSIKGASYYYHQTESTESDLISEGYDATQVSKLPTMGIVLSEEQLARDTIEREIVSSVSMNKAMRPIMVTEHYIRMDYDGGGARMYRVTTGGDDLEVLEREGGAPAVDPIDDDATFASMTPVPVTHRFYGRSIADLVIDIMQIKTALLRSLLDNCYLMNNQRIEVAESHCHERTLDDLLVNRPGGIVRTKQPGGLTPIPNEPIGNVIMPTIEYMDATREWRTGVTRQGQGLDANALQNQTATAINQAFNAAQARVKLIARILAETGIRDMFAMLHSLIRKNDRQANTVRLRNKWVTVDPRNWKTREDMTINVGLGTGTRQEQVNHLMMLLGLQKEAIMVPALASMVKPKNLYNTVEKLIERVGLKTIEPYFTDPEEVDPATGQPKPPPAPTPDPKLIELQAKNEIEKTQAQADIATQQMKTQSEMQLNERKFELEKELKLLDAQLKIREHEMQSQFSMQEHQAQAQEREQLSAQKDREGRMKMAEKGIRARKGPDGKEEFVAQSDDLAAIGDHLQAIHQTMGAHHAAIDTLHQYIAAPTEIVRDPVTGRAIGARKVMQGNGAGHA